MIFQLLLYLWKICNPSKNLWIWICIYFGPKCSMDWCDTAIESLRCKLFENKNFGYHYGTQRAVRPHEWGTIQAFETCLYQHYDGRFIYFGYHDSTQKYFCLKTWHLNFPNLHQELFCLFYIIFNVYLKIREFFVVFKPFGLKLAFTCKK